MNGYRNARWRGWCIDARAAGNKRMRIGVRLIVRRPGICGSTNVERVLVGGPIRYPWRAVHSWRTSRKLPARARRAGSRTICESSVSVSCCSVEWGCRTGLCRLVSCFLIVIPIGKARVAISAHVRLPHIHPFVNGFTGIAGPTSAPWRVVANTITSSTLYRTAGSVSARSGAYF